MYIVKEMCIVGKVVDVMFFCLNVFDLDVGFGLGVVFVDYDVNSFVDLCNLKVFYDFCKKVGDFIDVSCLLGMYGIVLMVFFEYSLFKVLLFFLMYGGV